MVRATAPIQFNSTQSASDVLNIISPTVYSPLNITVKKNYIPLITCTDLSPILARSAVIIFNILTCFKQANGIYINNRSCSKC